MTASVILLNPDGTHDVWSAGNDVLALANAAFNGSTDVVTCKVLDVSPDVLIGVIDDWGLSRGLPVNRRAWALYGGSPICGPMYVALDSGEDMDDEIVDAVLAPPSTQLNEEMDLWLEGHERGEWGWAVR